jgi:hypothetical protein
VHAAEPAGLVDDELRVGREGVVPPLEPPQARVEVDVASWDRRGHALEDARLQDGPEVVHGEDRRRAGAGLAQALGAARSAAGGEVQQARVVHSNACLWAAQLQVRDSDSPVGVIAVFDFCEVPVVALLAIAIAYFMSSQSLVCNLIKLRPVSEFVLILAGLRIGRICIPSTMLEKVNKVEVLITRKRIPD